MSEIFLHVGLHKTATSALQQRLRRNRESLSRNGFFYPDPGQFDAHHELASLLRVDDEASLINPAGEDQFFKGIAACKLEAFGRNVILSSEIFSQNVSRSAIPMLSRLFDKVSVVLYLRRQDTLLESVHNQMLKQSAFRSDDILHSGFYPACDLHGTVAMWKSLVGDRNVIVRRYEPGKMFMDDIAMDFLQAIGMPTDPCWSEMKSEQLNDSLSMIEYLVLDRLATNEWPAWHRVVDTTTQIVRTKFSGRDCQMVGNYLTYQERVGFMEEHAEGNAKLLGEFFPEDDRLFAAPVRHSDFRHDAGLQRDVQSAQADVLRELDAA
jgi:hypothetical protein